MNAVILPNFREILEISWKKETVPFHSWKLGEITTFYAVLSLSASSFTIVIIASIIIVFNILFCNEIQVIGKILICILLFSLSLIFLIV